jgi:hypothetical protein
MLLSALEVAEHSLSGTQQPTMQFEKLKTHFAITQEYQVFSAKHSTNM